MGIKISRVLAGDRSRLYAANTPATVAGAYSNCWQVAWLLTPYIIFTLAFGGVMVPKLNLSVWSGR